MFKKLTLVLLIEGVLVTNAWADPLPARDSRHEIDQMERRQSQQQIEDSIVREKALQSGKVQSENDFISQTDNGYKFLITRIVVENDDQYDSSPARQKIIDPYLNTKMGRADILQLVHEMGNFYIDRGYVTSTVTVVPGGLKTGELKLKVLWGKLAGFTVNGKEPKPFDRLRLFSAMPMTKGKPVNIRDIDQGVDNMLRVSRDDTLTIVPTEKFGESIIDLRSQPKFPLSLALGTNNSGTEETGWSQYTVNSTFSNLFSLNDTLSFFYAYNDLKNNNDNQDSWSANFSFPIGYWSFDFSSYRSEYDKTIGGYYGGYHSDGDSERTSAKISRVLYRNASGKFSGYLKTEVRESYNGIEGTQIDVSSKKYSSLNGGVNYVGSLAGGWLYADIGVTQGRPWFGSAWKNDPDLTGFDLNFTKYNGTLSWTKSLYQSGRFNVNYEFNSGFQYTNNQLVSDMKFSVGDEYSVRGYKDNYLTADKGGYISNTFSLPIMIGFAGIQQISPFVGYDLGMAKDNCSDNVDMCSMQYLTGAAVGIKASGSYFSSSLTMSWPLAIPGTLTNQDIDAQSLYYNVELKF